MYVLAEPKPDVKQQYVKQMQYSLLHDSQTLVQLIKDYKKQHPDLAKRMSRAMSRAVCKIAAKKVLNKAIQLRKENVGSLLKNIRLIKCLDIKENEDFGEGVHSAASEPYYFDASYQLVKIDFPIPVDENGKCMLATENPDNEIEKHTNKPLKWQCYSQCKPLTIAEVNAIVTLKEEFQKPIKEVLHTLQVCDDGCPNEHFSKSVEASPNNDIYLDCYAIDREGHPLVCFNDGNCVSKLRILRAASTHYPVLRNFLHALYNAIKSNVHVATIDNALCAADFHSLMEITKIEGFDSLLKYESRYEQPTDIVAADSILRNPNLESHLLLTHAKIIKDFEKEIEDFPEHACCSCERLHQRKCVTKIKLSDKLSSEVWPRLTSFITQNNVHVPGTLYICNYCKPLIKKNILPPRCVINGLQNISIPTEISKLDPLSMQLIQRAKCYQTVVRLGTYTAKVPIYNSLKACKGTMFFLPLPMNKTLETLDQVKDSSTNIAGKCWLPNSELFIIVNGKPTKGKVVWRNLVNVNHVKVAINKLN